MRSIGILIRDSSGEPGQFLRRLERRDWSEEKNLRSDLVDCRSEEDTEYAAERFRRNGAELRFCMGTGNAAVRRCSGIPIVYYGARPEEIELDTCGAPHVTGDVVEIPLISSKLFRFLRSFLPRARVLWAPFNAGTVFTRPAAHLAALEQQPGRIHRGSLGRWGGHPTVARSLGPIGSKIMNGASPSDFDKAQHRDRVASINRKSRVGTRSGPGRRDALLLRPARRARRSAYQD